MPSKLEIGDGHSVKRFLSWLERSDNLSSLAWYSRFRACVELFFYTTQRDDPNYLRVVEELGKPAVRELPQYFSMMWADMMAKPSDLLGAAYQEWSMGDRKRMAQYFTPDSVSAMMAQMTMGDTRREEFEKPGGLRIAEPACGAGGMIIQALNAIKKQHGDWGLARTVVVMTDLDIVCCWMATVQVFWFPGTLGGVHVFHGDSLGPPDNVKCIGSLGAGLPPLEYVKRLRAVHYERRIRNVREG